VSGFARSVEHLCRQPTGGNPGMAGMIIVQKLWVRTVVLFVVMIIGPLAMDQGRLDILLAHPLGHVTLWVYNLTTRLCWINPLGKPVPRGFRIGNVRTVSWGRGSGREEGIHT